MNILQIIPTLQTGGAEKLLSEFIPICVKEGHTVDLLLFNGSDSIFLQSLKEQSICNVYYLGKGSVYNPLFILKTRSFLKKYDIIHVHLFPALYIAALAKILLWKNIPLVYTEHSTNNKRRNNSFLKPIENFIYNRYSKIITISSEVDEALRKHLTINSSKITTISNGIDINKYMTALPYNKKLFFNKGNSKILIQVSSFRYPKDQATIIKSLKLLPDNINLLLVGEGPLKKDMEVLCQKLDLTDRVIFLGIRTDIPQLLKTADIIILSSAYEGLSLSSLEALSSERPLIASDVKGIHDVVNEAGILFDYQDANNLSKEVRHLLSDENYYTEIVKKCIARSNHYDIRKMVSSYIKLYKEMLNE